MSSWRSHFSAEELEELDYVRLMYPAVDKLLGQLDHWIPDTLHITIHQSEGFLKAIKQMKGAVT